MKTFQLIESNKKEFDAESRKEEIEIKVLSMMTWIDIVNGLELPFSQGEAIKKIMQGVGGKHKRISYRNCYINIAGDDLPIYGIETHYKDRIIQSYWIDNGCNTACLAMHETIKELQEVNSLTEAGQ